MRGAGRVTSAVRRLGGSWQGFWHADAPTLSLAVFRILFAYCLFREVSTTRSHSIFAISGGFHVPYLSFIAPVSPETYHLLHDLQYPFILLLGLGALTRVSCGTLLALQGYIFFSDYMNFRNHPYFFLLVLFALLLSPADEALSFRSLRRRVGERWTFLAALLGRDHPLTFQRLLQVQICIVYFYAALHKLHAYYLHGEVLAGYARTNLMDGVSGALLGRFFDGATLAPIEAWLGEPQHQVIPAMLVVGMELSIPIALWFRRTRPWAILAGIGFHVSIALLMDIRTFSLAMIASYLLFLDPRTLPECLRGLRFPGSRRETPRPAPA